MITVPKFLPVLLVLAACGGGPSPETTPVVNANRASAEQLDSLWARASTRLADEEWDDAAVLFQRLLLELPRRDARQPMARLALGDARLGQNSYLQAVREYRRASDDYPSDSLAPMGLLRAGDSYAKLWRRPELDPTFGTQAMATWNELLTRFPESPIADSARSRIVNLEEWFAIKAFKAAEFYLKYKADDSAIIYLKDLVARFPRAQVVPAALTRLVESYQRLGYDEDVAEMCGYFRANHPQAPDLEKSCPGPSAAAAPRSGQGSADGS